MCTPLLAKGISIGPTGSINLGGGTLNLGCGDLQVDGILSLGNSISSDIRHVAFTGQLIGQSGVLNVTGDWLNSGLFESGTSTLALVDGCATTSSQMSGDSSFHDWSVTTSSGKQLIFTAGDEQNIANAVVFAGAAGNLLQIRSSEPDSPGFMELAEAGSQFVDHVDVKDNHALMPGQFMAPGFPEDYNSVDSGGNSRWFGSNTFTITVHKNFNDGNPSAVMVAKECNTGLPLNVSIGVSEDNPITFVTTSIDSGNTNCTVTEIVPAGYAAAYSVEAGGASNPDGCVYQNVEQGSELECFIENSIVPAEVIVRKSWIDEHPEFMNPMFAEAEYQCSGEGQLDEDAAEGVNLLFFYGQDATDRFTVIPHWNGQTRCTVSEVEVSPEVESDDSECAGIAVLPGHAAPDYDCTIINTRSYPGIPTLGRTSLALLALLLLGVGVVLLRRSVY